MPLRCYNDPEKRYDVTMACHEEIENHLKERSVKMEKEIYRDCQRNHACSLGGYAIDGCTEFIQGNTISSTQIEACGCHRNYHRKVVVDLKRSPDHKSFMSLREVKRMARQRGVVVPPTPSTSDEVKVKQRKSKFSAGQRER
ncbi:zinc-finger homeodomain protein 14-like [Hibiscus syriacus]|uniref:zinc-finger homeodomain protein 14-like n=1 Tax=Hibiscus syriacus TaxID=106335 RepID=UPI0019206C18|nr:zinc-finger homeodomain protein 14-like [Hibiscus syriacus]